MTKLILLLCILTVMVFSIFRANGEELLTEKEVLNLFQTKSNSPALDKENYELRLKNLLPLDKMIKENPTNVDKSYSFLKISLPNSVDLRKFDSKVKSQWNGTCTSFGMTALREHLACSVLKKCGLDMSERHFWSFYHEYSATSAVSVAHKYVAMESNWPQNSDRGPSGIDAKGVYAISGFKYGGQDSKLLLQVLAQGKPVYFWSHVPKEMSECRVNVSTREFVDGGHAYKISGYFNLADPVLIVKNSWGSACGDKGYQYVKLSVFNPKPTGTGYWSFAYADTIVEKGAQKSCVEVCKPRFLIFGKVCQTVCQ